MVNFHDPLILARDFCAYHSLFVCLGQLENPAGPVFWQGFSPSSVTCWMVSTCKSMHLVLSLHVTRLGFTHIPDIRWEFFPSLDYEWRVVQGRVYYRCSIWVRISSWAHRLLPRQTDLFLSLWVDILSFTHFHAHGRDHEHRRFQHDGPT